jgi:hypothetical protein
MVTAFTHGLMSKTTLLRGDIDAITLRGRDDDGNDIGHPFDIVSLDYSGGLFYRGADGESPRLQAIRKVVERQARSLHDYVLFISSNLDNHGDAEVTATLANIKTDLNRAGRDGTAVMAAYLSHEMPEAKLKLYVPYFIGQSAAAHSYQCETEKVIFYQGNRRAHMMNFRFYLKPDLRTTAPRSPKEPIWEIVNAPLVEIRNGRCRETTLGLPKARRNK